MKKKYFILTIFILLDLSLNAQQSESLDKQFYYYRNEKNYIPIDFSRISIVSKGKVNVDKVRELVNGHAFKIKNNDRNYTRQNVIPVDENEISKMIQNDSIFISEMEFLEDINQTDYFEIIQHLSKDDNIIKTAPTFFPSNHNLGISNNFYVKLFKREDLNILFDLAEKYSIQILGYNEFLPLWFTLSCPRESSLGAIDAANLFFETGLFECAEPEFLYHNLRASNDPYFSNQWGLKNTGQYGGTIGLDIKVEQAWTISTGSNVRVAVFDHGFERNHPDLVNNNYGTGYDATTNTTPAWVRGDHGTACAGIIGAQYNNAEGIAGVAPNSNLMSISIDLFYSDTPQQLANGFSWAWRNGADIISNSWGFVPGWWSYAPSTFLENAIDSTMVYGRNGKGTIVVFASGNEDDTNIRYPGNFNPDILVVGAMSPCGERKSPVSCDTENCWGSNYGQELDIVAPGVLIPTTDRQGSLGYNPNEPIHPWCNGTKISVDFINEDYTVWFDGTSAACPHVAGVAALVLSVNPSLTGQQVRNIIESTAQKVGDYNYQADPDHPNGTWHEEMGYGLVDAYAAVQAACSDSPVNLTNQTVTSDTTVNSCNDINVQDVDVTNNAKLQLNAVGKVVINGRLEIGSGSKLEMNTGQ